MSDGITVSIHTCTLVVNEEQVKFTMKIAKQLPVHLHRRRNQIENDRVKPPDAICKVMHCILNKESMSQEWMYLVDEPDFGMYWTLAFAYDDDFNKVLGEKGYFVDEPLNVPTVILQ